MGSIDVVGSCNLRHRKHDSMDIPSTHHGDNKNFKSFEIDGVISGQIPTPTGVREEILLLAWLLVLLRTRENGQISYGWGYKCQADDFEHEMVNNTLVMDEVITGLQDSVGQVAEAIFHHITTITSGEQMGLYKPVSLLLRSNSLFKGLDEGKDEVSEHASYPYSRLTAVKRVFSNLKYVSAMVAFGFVRYGTAAMCFNNQPRGISRPSLT